MKLTGKAMVAKRKRQGYKVLGFTHDGVAILEPTVKPKSCTIEEIREVVREVLSGALGADSPG
jgi:hypothetical protein